MMQKTALSVDEMIDYGKELVMQEIQKWHYFSARVTSSEEFSKISLYVDGYLAADLPYHAIPANQSKTSIMRFVAEKIHEMDPRTKIVDLDDELQIQFIEEFYIQVLKEHYMVMPTEDILSLCREKIFVKHYSYIRPYKIEVNKDGILILWGDWSSRDIETVYRFKLFQKPKSLESIYIICHIINEYSGNRYKYSNLLGDNKYKYGEAAILMIKNDSDKFDRH